VETVAVATSDELLLSLKRLTARVTADMDVAKMEANGLSEDMPPRYVKWSCVAMDMD